jgi:hypothetical protein
VPFYSRFPCAAGSAQPESGRQVRIRDLAPGTRRDRVDGRAGRANSGCAWPFGYIPVSGPGTSALTALVPKKTPV